MEFKKKPLYDFVKRLFDLFVSLTFLLCTWPIYLIIAIIISVSDGQGKPFFSQVRCGKNGKKFTLYKFRTMCVDAEAKKEELMDQNEADGPAFKIKDDPRITPLGKTLRATNIDEFPQMLNILLGDMSFVGPRPPLPDEVECFWQASTNRNDLTFDEWVELDRKYIRERSVGLDLKLIFMTIGRIIKHHDGR